MTPHHRPSKKRRNSILWPVKFSPKSRQAVRVSGWIILRRWENLRKRRSLQSSCRRLLGRRRRRWKRWVMSMLSCLMTRTGFQSWPSNARKKSSTSNNNSANRRLILRKNRIKRKLWRSNWILRNRDCFFSKWWLGRNSRSWIMRGGWWRRSLGWWEWAWRESWVSWKRSWIWLRMSWNKWNKKINDKKMIMKFWPKNQKNWSS